MWRNDIFLDDSEYRKYLAELAAAHGVGGDGGDLGEDEGEGEGDAQARRGREPRREESLRARLGRLALEEDEQGVEGGALDRVVFDEEGGFGAGSELDEVLEARGGAALRRGREGLQRAQGVEDVRVVRGRGAVRGGQHGGRISGGDGDGCGIYGLF